MVSRLRGNDSSGVGWQFRKLTDLCGCVFRKRATSGFWLCQKRFSRGKLAWWPTGNSTSVRLRASELLILLAQGHPIKAGLPEDWLSVSHAASVDDRAKEIW